MAVFCEMFSSEEDVFSFFQVNRSDRVGVNIIFAFYDVEDWDGDAFVLFEKDGLLYEVHGSHCSCYGLEDQWCPEETNKEALLHVALNGQIRLGNHTKQYINILNTL